MRLPQWRPMAGRRLGSRLWVSGGERPSAAFRTKVVAESVAAGARVREVARRHGICRASSIDGVVRPTNNANGSRMRLFPIRIAASPDPPPPPRAPVSAPRRAGLIKINCGRCA